MIRMQLERRAHAGYPDLACPKFFCDFCARPIQHAGLGLYVGDGRLENEAYFAGEPVDIYTVHKGDCDVRLCSACSAMGWHCEDASTMKLATLPVYLAQNMGMRSRKDWEEARALADFGG
jgi:hypothetical protein